MTSTSLGTTNMDSKSAPETCKLDDFIKVILKFTLKLISGYPKHHVLPHAFFNAFKSSQNKINFYFYIRMDFVHSLRQQKQPMICQKIEIMTIITLMRASLEN